MIALGKNKIKFINSLKIKKFRDIHGKFVIEGNKIVKEIIQKGIPIDLLICEDFFIKEISGLSTKSISEISIVNENEIKKISSFKTPSNAIAIIEIPKKELIFEEVFKDFTIVLDNIQDPGNLGTIIRTADWFGIKNIICSKESADCYNPKVLQSTMGSVFRVNVFYIDLPFFLQKAKEAEIDIYGTFLEGESIYKIRFNSKGIILMGNESKGISKDLFSFISKKITIPSFSGKTETVESLNVAIATAIVFSEIRRT